MKKGSCKKVSLDLRKIRILQAIIDDYILTASPVGSRAISKHPDINLSSATIRNEMSDLEEYGYLEQPHTSAGRIPSDKAYRYYVNSMMQRAMLTEDELKFIEQHFSRTVDDADKIIRQTAMVLSDMTNYATMVLPPNPSAIRLRRIELVPVTDGKALVVIVTNLGVSSDTLIRIPKGITADRLHQLSNMLTDNFANCRIEDITANKIALMTDILGSGKEYIDEMLARFKGTILTNKSNVEFFGTSKLLDYPEYSDVDKAKALLDTIERKDSFKTAISGASNLEFSITIGSENNDPIIKDCSVVTATYRVSGEKLGSLGVIGPTRMDYSRVLALLEHFGKSLGTVLTNMIDEENN
ncbi:MAG: heat-inducible transcription repressor HrcA [Clostridia bacterium]|nr:heat-inducible transcription repressor HrcA [Clostridia bacterium]